MCTFICSFVCVRECVGKIQLCRLELDLVGECVWEREKALWTQSFLYFFGVGVILDAFNVFLLLAC